MKIAHFRIAALYRLLTGHSGGWKYWKKNTKRYDEGYEALKEKRFESLEKARNDQKCGLPASHPNIQILGIPFSEEQKKEARKMELYAGMVDNCGLQHRAIDLNHLKEIGRIWQYAIVFMSDTEGRRRRFLHTNENYGPIPSRDYSGWIADMGKVKLL